MVLWDDLFALYHFNNDGWIDASENGNNGAATGSVFDASTKKLGSHSVYLDGLNDYIRIQNEGSDPTDFNVTELTILVWLYYQPTSSYDIVIAKRSGSTDGSWQLNIINSTKKLGFNWNVGGAWKGPKDNGIALTENAWNMIGIRFSSVNKEIEFIVNNTIESPQPVTDGLSITTRPVYIGWDSETSYGGGNQDELAFYNVLKSNADISAYWNGGAGIEIAENGIQIFRRRMEDY